MNTALWLARYQRPGAPEGPTRGTHLREQLEPGDVWEDGAIEMRTGPREHCGPIWVGEDQAIRASYYGWEIDQTTNRPVSVEMDGGERLWRIVRATPPSWTTASCSFPPA